MGIFRPQRNGVKEGEQQVLGCLSQGLRYKEIADNPGISYQTVRTYIGRICETLKVRTRTGGRRQAPRALVEGAGTFIAFRIHPSSFFLPGSQVCSSSHVWDGWQVSLNNCVWHPQPMQQVGEETGRWFVR